MVAIIRCSFLLPILYKHAHLTFREESEIDREMPVLQRGDRSRGAGLQALSFDYQAPGQKEKCPHLAEQFYARLLLRHYLHGDSHLFICEGSLDPNLELLQISFDYR
jgi:hypothetical protein